MKNAFGGILCLIALTVSARAASPVDGKWQVQFSSPQGAVFVIFDLKANGNAIAGTVSNWAASEQLHKIPIQDGKVEGDKVTFNTFHPIPFLFGKTVVEWEHILWNWGAALNTVTGTVSNDTMVFTQRNFKGDTIQFQAIRVK